MFYGWKLCALTSFGNFILQGSIIYMMNAFMEPMTQLHGWTRADITFGMSIAALLGALSIPVWASLALRYSIRFVMSLGALLGGLSLMGIGLMDLGHIDIDMSTRLWGFYLCYTVAWASGQSFGGATANILLNQWFSKHRGQAFGFANFGTSFSGAFMPFVLMLIIIQLDVQSAWILYGLLILCFAPICWFVIRDTPAMLGLHVDNDPDTPEFEAKPVQPISIMDALKKPPVLYLGFIFGFALLAGSAIVSQLKPHMVDVGLDVYTAMTIACVTALFLAIAKYAWGLACDRFNPILILRGLLVLIFLSMGLIFMPPKLWTLMLFCPLFGLALGGIWVVVPACVAFYFGNKKFLYYYRVISTFVLLKAVGFSLLGLSYTWTQSYDAAYMFFEGVYLICIILSFLLKTDPAKDRHVGVESGECGLHDVWCA